ncbi:hypothetical protein B0H13DRAFT_2128596 [Mycena leptocephala]|nr:hypothetical protein B0H13DRAFT_2128596 [Mycena leptocephala]
MSPLPRHVTSRLVFACEPMLRERRVSELEIADHSISPHVEQRHSAPIEPERVRDPAPKPRSRRCFVCGTTGMHPLDFRICPRTAVLLRRSLAKINDDGRLVSIDGSPLPMTRHPGGVAAHIISRVRSSRLLVTEPSESSAPRPAPLIFRHIPCPPSFTIMFHLHRASSTHVPPTRFLPLTALNPSPSTSPIRRFFLHTRAHRSVAREPQSFLCSSNPCSTVYSDCSSVRFSHSLNA